MCHQASNAEELMNKIWREPFSGSQRIPALGKWNYWVPACGPDRVSVQIQSRDVGDVIRIVLEEGEKVFSSPRGTVYDSFSSAISSLGLTFEDYSEYVEPTIAN